jgi:hypothetical protein
LERRRVGDDKITDLAQVGEVFQNQAILQIQNPTVALKTKKELGIANPTFRI